MNHVLLAPVSRQFHKPHFHPRHHMNLFVFKLVIVDQLLEEMERKASIGPKTAEAVVEKSAHYDVC